MKKVLLVICFILFSFLFIKDSSAATFSLVDSSNCVIAENGKIESCSIAIDVDGTLTATVFPEIRVTLTHAEYQSFTAGSDWNVSIINQTSTLITFRAVYKGTSIPSGQTEIFSITVQSNGTPSDPCRITVGLEPPVYSCRRIYQNGGYIYYNSQGQIVSESVFNSECNPKCELKDGVYYGPEGQILDNELAMLNACNSFVCQSYQGPSGTTYYFNKIGNSVSQSSMISSCSCTKIGDTYYKNNMVVAINETDMLIDCYNPVCRSYQGPSGTTYYFGKNGQSVSNEAAMKASCGCQHIGNKYYDANGNETTKVNYIKSCQNPVCVEVEGYYFDSNGNNVTKAQMYKSCYACSEVDGKYYNANGVETTKLNYIKSCQNPKCDEVDGYYFDSNGNNVTEAQMLKSCNACKEENGKYYDSNGVETTKVNYIMSCQSPKCSYIDGYYFDKDGNNVTEAQMRKSCFSCKEENGIYYNSDGVQTTKINYIMSCQNPKCTEYDGYYFDKDGNQVADAAAVIQSCDNPKCMKINDNTYFDKNGNRVNSLEAYAKSCLVCQQYEDKYIKKDGTITEDVNEYIISCNSPKCESVKINNKTYYYDMNGKLLNNEDEFNYYCTKHICKIITINGETSYYDNEGNETDETTYNSMCKNKIICETKVKDGITIYYDKYGKEVSQIIYQQQCLINSCKKVGDKYYDKDGKEITKIQYQQQCQVNKCEKIGNKYYDKDGKEVSKEDFDKACNPNTGSWIPKVSLLLLGVGGGAIYITKRKKVLFKI